MEGLQGIGGPGMKTKKIGRLNIYQSGKYWRYGKWYLDIADGWVLLLRDGNLNTMEFLPIEKVEQYIRAIDGRINQMAVRPSI
jgi:hypothetical protein